MKRVTFLLLLNGLVACAQAQNLVPNPSFEDTVSCPAILGSITASYWYSARNSPDYFHRCGAVAESVSVPANGFGTQSPYPSAYGQNGYLGMITYCGEFVPYREFIGCQLISPMQPGTTYYASFKIALAENSAFAHNKIGIRFYTVQHLVDTLVNQPAPVDNNAHVWTDAIISDTSWYTVSGQFVADSTYAFMIIGNFFDGPNTSAINYPGEGADCAYYFVDEVCVSADSSLCEIGNSLSNHQNGLTITYDDHQGHIYIHSNSSIAECTLVDVLGRPAFNDSLYEGQYIDVKNIPCGAYIFKARSNSKSASQKLLIMR